MKRRTFLRSIGAGGAALGLGSWLRTTIASAGGDSPIRLAFIHRPNGTVPSQWLPGGTPGPIMAPFADLHPQMLALDGLRIAPSEGNGSATHEGGMVTLATGEPIGASRNPGGDDWLNTARSLDQRLADASPFLMTKTVRTLAVAAHNRQDGSPEVANLTLSYQSPGEPIYPESNPVNVYMRLFASIAPGEDPVALMRARQRRQSVLDFALDDLTALRTVAPSSERERLDAHEAAIRALERRLDTSTVTCVAPSEPTDVPDTDDHTDVLARAELMMAAMRTAFTCDMIGISTFMWSMSASRVQFEELYSGMGRVQHHSLSHDDVEGNASVRRTIAAIDTWYAEQTANFVRSLRDAPDPAGGSLLDRTLVVYWSEVSLPNVHSFEGLPVVLFGGTEVGLPAGPVRNVEGTTTNDLWRALFRRFGAPGETFGTSDMHTGGLDTLLTG
jgi:hypothetical protein